MQFENRKLNWKQEEFMKVCFINPPFKAGYGKFSRESRSPSIGHSGVLYYPLWLIYAAAVVEKEGYDIAFIDAPAKRLTVEETLLKVEKEASDTLLFVLDTSTPSIKSDVMFGACLKERFPHSKIMLVGTHPSVMDDETMGYSKSIDFIARHEYDFIVRDTVKALDKGMPIEDIRGLTYRDTDGKVNKTMDAEYIEDLDNIPFASEFIKRHLEIDDYVFPAAHHPEIQIFTGRGCPAHCYFCVYPQTLHGHKFRLRSPENVVAEFQYIYENFPEVKEIVFEDDTFTANKQHVIAICDLLIIKGLHKKLHWLCNARVNLDFETMKKMKAAGCRLIIPGVESYNEQILKNIKKGIKKEWIAQYMKNARKAGLMVHACYMVGNMGETKETMEVTLKAAIKFKTDTAQFFPLIPYPGTEAYEWAKSNGYISGNYEDYLQEDGTLNCILNTPELSAQELVDFCAYARRKYYIRPWYIIHRLWMGLRDPDDMKRSLKAFWNLKDSLLK